MLLKPEELQGWVCLLNTVNTDPYLLDGFQVQPLPRPATVLGYITGLPRNPSVSSSGHFWAYSGNLTSPMFDPEVQVYLTLHLKSKGSLKAQLQGLTY